MTKRKLVSDFRRAEESPGLLLWQLSNKWQAKQRAALKLFDLTHVQFVLLAALTYADGTSSLTQKQLAEYAQTDIMMTSQVLRKLEQKGLVQRKPSWLDGRAFTPSPTAAGVELANRAIKIVEKVDKNFFAAVDPELTSLVKMMRLLVK